MSGDDLSLRILDVEPGDEIAGARCLRLRTTRGEIPIIVHAPEVRPVEVGAADAGAADAGADDAPARAVLCVSGALGGFDGPGKLNAMQYGRAAIVGHSFGGAVAINAGTLSSTVTTVVAVSSQLAGAHVVAELAPRPLLLLHGTADTILPHECSERIYERAREPRTLKLFPGVGHRFTEAADELLETVRGWLLAHL
jgi:fermentation-respiration switch protein FrsA (DUF1100 family)